MAKTQITTAAEAAALVKDGMTLMVGGFMANGTPEPIIDELVKSNVKDLTVICNDAGFGRKKDKVTGEWKGAARGVGKLVENGQVKKLIASHVGLNPEFGAKYFEGEIDLELVPQGTLAERIDAVVQVSAVFIHRQGLVQKWQKAKKSRKSMVLNIFLNCRCMQMSL